MITLYAKDVSGNIRVWEIHSEMDEIVITHGVEGGAMQEKREYVPHGKAGRDIDEQIESRINSRINRQLDKGYVRKREDAVTQKRTNSAGFLRPMLAMPFNKVKRINYTGALMQFKYDGNRCLITNKNGKNIAYSRNGKILNVPHITNTISIPKGFTIDGELYCHGEKLQTICSWIKRQQENTKKINYHIYDIITDDSYFKRFELMKHQISFGPHSEIVPTFSCNSKENAQAHMAKARMDGYEGVIIRTNGYGYEDGKRSKSLIKMKMWLDANCRIIDVHESVDGWAIFECEFEGKSFRVSAPGTMDEKINAWIYRDKYLWKFVRVEYSMLTADGVPFHPVAVAYVG